MRLFNMDANTKQQLAQISALFGAKADIAKEVWEFTVFTMLLKLAGKDEGLVSINIPHIGSIGIRQDGNEVTSDGKLEPSLTAFVSLSDEFKKLYKKAKAGKFGDLSQYIQEECIEPLSETIGS